MEGFAFITGECTVKPRKYGFHETTKYVWTNQTPTKQLTNACILTLSSE